MGKLGDLGFHCCQIHGGMPLVKRIEAEREFYEHIPSIMVATEAAGEGINLQFCSLMVNYDLPWNPNRLEQRIKAQRFGEQYWLYVVVNCKTKPELHLIQNPAAKLTPREEVSVVRYMIGQQDWQNAAIAGDPTP